jgi:hypothetical protein
METKREKISERKGRILAKEKKKDQQKKRQIIL